MFPGGMGVWEASLGTHRAQACEAARLGRSRVTRVERDEGDLRPGACLGHREEGQGPPRTGLPGEMKCQLGPVRSPESSLTHPCPQLPATGSRWAGGCRAEAFHHVNQHIPRRPPQHAGHTPRPLPTGQTQRAECGRAWGWLGVHRLSFTLHRVGPPRFAPAGEKEGSVWFNREPAAA